ncbi:MAG: DUF1992 domain-containing protein [bacterium]|nr:DUF1992 domain-containing protein [bacterium]
MVNVYRKTRRQHDQSRDRARRVQESRGSGKPINLDEYFATPEDVRMGYSVLKSNQIVPEEVDRLKEIGELREQLKTCSEEERPLLSKLLRDRDVSPGYDPRKKQASVTRGGRARL